MNFFSTLNTVSPETEKNFKITKDNFREAYAKLQRELEIQISKNNLVGKDSDVDLFHTIGEIFRVKYVYGKQEELIALLKDSTTSDADKKILQDIVIYSNLPLVLNTVNKGMFNGKGGNKKYRFEGVSEGEIYSAGILLIKEAVDSYNPDFKGKFVVEVLESAIVDNALELTINQKTNKMKSIKATVCGETVELTVNEEGKIVVPVSELCEELVSEINAGKQVKFVNELPEDSEFAYIVMEGKSVSFSTHLNTKMMFGVQDELLAANGVKIPPADDILIKKMFYGMELYKKLVDKKKVHFFNHEYVSPEFVPVEAKVVSANPYEDDYYANSERVAKIEKVEAHDKAPDEASPRWIAIFMLTQNKKFQVIRIGDVYDIIVSTEKELGNKEEIYSVNYEKLVFTPKTEKLIEKTIAKNMKVNLHLNSFNSVSLNAGGDEDDEREGIEVVEAEGSSIDSSIQVASDVGEFMEQMFKRVLMKVSADNVQHEVRDAVVTFMDTYDYEEVEKVHGKAVMKIAKKVILATTLELKKEIENAYGESATHFLNFA